MTEPVLLADAKAYLRLFTSDEDDKITAMIPRARRWVEDFTGLALDQREFTEIRRTERNRIRLFKGPVVGDPAVSYGAAGTYTPQSLDGVLYAAADAAWPVLDEGEGFEIVYTAGFADGEVPDELIGAVLALIEGEYSDGFAYPQRAIDAAERCCGFARQAIL